MRLRRLWLTDFRSYETARVDPAPGLTAVLGDNGTGKTNLLEAIGFLAGLTSFRGAQAEALVRVGAERAVVRAEAETAGREILLEVEIAPGGRSRAQVNRQPTARRRDLLDVFRVTVFTPDDLRLVKGGPGERRRFLDDAMVVLHPPDDALRLELERILRQRNALLRQAGGRLTAEIETTLAVWDQKLTEVGETIRRRREELVEALRPQVVAAYGHIAAEHAATTDVDIRYRCSWAGGSLRDRLLERRDDDVRRRRSGVGPHRDDLDLVIDGLPTRTHGSQGEQRSLALALRLAVHSVATERIGSAPVLLLDDVFSELDEGRSRALVEELPPGQVFLSSAGGLPPGIEPERCLHVADGRVEET